MLADLANFDEIVRQNKLKEVTNPIYLRNGLPTEDGIFSYEIFGRPSSPKRKTNWAYIDLKGKFLNPLVFDAVYKLNRKIPNLLMGIAYARIEPNGALTIVDTDKSDEKGWFTGLSAFISNITKINFSHNKENPDNENLKFLQSISLKTAIISKWLVIPPFYRDISLEDATGVDEISELYKKLIALSKIGENMRTSLFMIGSNSKIDFSIQDTINEIFTILTAKNSKKTGNIRQNLLGKSVDYAIRAVISAQKTAYERPEKMLIQYGEVGIPLHLAMYTYFPLVVKALDIFFSELHNYVISIPSDNGGTITFDTSSKETLNHKAYKKLIDLYARDIDARVRPLDIFEKENSKKDNQNLLAHLFPPDMLANGKFLTLTDLLFFVVTTELVASKEYYCYLTRYPITDYRSVIPLKPVILTTRHTKELKYPIHNVFNNEICRNISNFYPDLSDLNRLEWIDSVQPHFGYLSQLGADYDGDELE